MKILTRYVLKEMIGPTILGFIFYTSIILMRQLFDLAGMIIRRSLSAAVVGKLLLLMMPSIIVLTVPMALLFGILIAIGRFSADSEIVAMRALGISTRTIYRPVFFFSVAIFLLSFYLINFVLPKGNAQYQALSAELITSSVQKDVQPRVFYDEYENLVIYVDDIDRTTGAWKGVFVSDTRSTDLSEPTTPAEVSAEAAAHADETPSALTQRSGQRIVVAQSGTLSVLKNTRQVWMNLYNAENHVWDPRRPDRYDRTGSRTQRLLVADRSTTDLTSLGISKSLRAMDLRELLGQIDVTRKSLENRRRNPLDREADRITYNMARVEIHKKFALPFACLVFGVLGLPLGITNRRGGRSSGFSLSIAIILVYYVMITGGEQMAAAGRVSPFIGMWSANILLLIIGIYLLIRANRDIATQSSEASLLQRIGGRIAGVFQRLLGERGGTVVEDSPSVLSRLDITFPNLLDRYILKEFLKVLFLVLLSVMAIFIIVDFTELARSIRDNVVAFHTIFAYYRFLSFQVLNWTLPISVLVSTLVTFAILSKNNEVTALKSGGVSLYRAALPIVAVAAVISVFSYFILDYVLPYSNQRVATLKRKIEGKKPIATTSAQKQWFYGKGHYLINFLAYDRDRQELSQVQVFEFHPSEFKLARRVFAQRAKWNGRAWMFEDGWMRSFTDDGRTTYTPITTPLMQPYRETPEDFETDIKAPDQMTFAQLHRYISNIKKAGYAADDLAVKLYTKTSWPFISLVMALIAMPFAFRMGPRGGALYGIGLALILGIVYWMVFAIFTKFGEVGNLPAVLSAWAANILFAMAAVYLFLHVET